MNTDVFILSPCLSHSCLQFVFMNTCRSMGFLWFTGAAACGAPVTAEAPGIWEKREKKCICHKYNLLKCFPLHILGPTSQIHLNTLHSSPC